MPATPPVASAAAKPITDNAKAKKTEPKGNIVSASLFGYRVQHKHY